MVLIGICITSPVVRISVILVFLVLSVIWTWNRVKANSNTLRRTGYLLWLLGILSNYTVFLANGGWMPVLGRKTFDGVWMPMMDTTKYNWLGDRFWGASIGDFLIFGMGLFLCCHFILTKKHEE